MEGIMQERKDIVKMRLEELDRLRTVYRAIDKAITQRAAASEIKLSERQIRRIVKRVREEGDRGIVHRLRDRPSKRKISEKMRESIISLYKKKYDGFGPTFATEKLLERDKIQVSRETLRNWLITEGFWVYHRKGREHRKNRPRKQCCGNMVILDGSHHDWLEGRGPWLVLMAYIDDATSRLYARFYDYEGTIPAMDSFRRYIKKYGIPQSIYTDRHTTYKSPKKPTIEDELANREPQSQFERALEELGVTFIHANSPEAKGRVERVFKTLQDRLVKEMRLKNIKTKEEANNYLGCYLPVHNSKFSVRPYNMSDAHYRLPRGIDLNSVLCIREKRTIRKDWTIRYHNKFYQIMKIPSGLRPKYVWVEEHINGGMFMMYKGFQLSFKEIEVRLPKKDAINKRKKVLLKKKYIPPKDHPWRKLNRVVIAENSKCSQIINEK